MKNITMETGSGISWGGAGIGLLGLVNEIEWVTLVGMVVAIGGFVMNFYFSYKKDRREAQLSSMKESRDKEEHELKKQVYLSQIKHRSGNEQ
ncbi:hypothetical protein BWD09_07040 [Neisseria dentiae]|uniref:Holin n=1 Tax=Neisseria dentiae TaxID=194197 RepID=A0A1X3D9D5_9NEIS|nr:holin [Neisseria dentiae]OSI16513.1 hypothetical protein BWD09_07040 [Neisseria dentiae]QMT44239.1 hypothetical protein H3L92_07000 [Neisseria dentiae]STZ49912.1 Uncharacterised protein [Neisseria dentiae]STZ83152.1 Uncharacterised protein [Neisseria dentiae]